MSWRYVTWVLNRSRLGTVLLVLTGLAGCTNAIKPEDLSTPSRPTCVEIPQRLVASGKYGLLKIEWEIHLERGPYLSEKEDAEGTYYRAPPGGVYIERVGQKDSPPGVSTHMNYDGGFIIPHDQTRPPRLYHYDSVSSVPVQVPPEEANCSTAGYIADPSSEKVSLIGFMAGGALGGVVGQAVVGSSQLNYGQAAAGGAIAGVIVASLINMDVGKIVPGMRIEDQVFLNKLRALHAQAVPLEKLPFTKAEMEIETAERRPN